MFQAHDINAANNRPEHGFFSGHVSPTEHSTALSGERSSRSISSPPLPHETDSDLGPFHYANTHPFSCRGKEGETLFADFRVEAVSH